MIGIIGLSHKTAPIHIREQFALDDENSKALAKKICSGQHIDAMLILSTCNRTEFYYRTTSCNRDVANMVIVKNLVTFTGVTDCQKSYFYGYEHQDAVNHLFRVVSSLDSIVLGEYQIVSQIKNAFQLADENGTLDKELTRLFHKALEAGKQVRTQTKMSTGAFSLSYAAVEKCALEFPKLTHKEILLIGTGETGELTVRSLYKKGCKNITLINRTKHKADILAKNYDAKVRPFEELDDAVIKADIVISAVGAQEPVVNTTTNQRRQLMIDLGVPRNINEELNSFSNVTLVNVDDLQEVVANNQEKKKALIATAEEIIDEKVSEFLDWLSGRNLSPTIQKIIHRMHATQQTELEVFAKNKTQDELALLSEFSRHYSEKMANTMIKNLKILSDNGRHSDYVKIVNKLFSE
ncbi:MAG: glutamyl-tRNA reductase [Mangrovibacterium sp.]